MHGTRRALLAAAVPLALLSFALSPWRGGGGEPEAIRTSERRPPTTVSVVGTEATEAAGTGDLAAYLQAEAERQWYEGVARAEAEAAWYEGVARAEAARRAAPAASSYHPGTTDGDCYSVSWSIPLYIIERESGGNSSAYNASGAYGCAQTLLSHYSRGSCQGLDPYTLAGQQACVDILSGGGTNLQPWAATR